MRTSIWYQYRFDLAPELIRKASYHGSTAIQSRHNALIGAFQTMTTEMPNTSERTLLALLQKFSDAWNRHDLAGLMACMDEDCVFHTSAGPLAQGTTHRGAKAVAQAFAAAWQTIPDAQWRNGRHFVSGERGVSEWTFTGTMADGSRIEADGVDVFTFRNGRILVKNAFRKDRPTLPPVA